MEAIQVHSKSWVVRWIDVSEGYSIAWNVQPHKKGLNLGIFKHPGTTGGLSPSIANSLPATIDQSPNGDETRTKSVSETSRLVGVLEGHGLKCVSWEGKCEADSISIGRYDVPPGGSGTYGIVLDNTFSRTVAKDVTLAYVVHTTNTPPKFGGLRAQQRKTSAHVHRSDLPLRAPTDGAQDHPVPHITVGKHANDDRVDEYGDSYFTGTMYKKRRKRNQGYAKRFFSLDFTSATLSYYRNSRSSALRGAIPLALASIGVDGRACEFHIDSGSEVWHLRLRNKKDFETWKRAMARIASSPMVVHSALVQSTEARHVSPAPNHFALDQEWHRVETLVARVSGSRHALSRLVDDTEPKLHHALSMGQIRGLSPSTSTNDVSGQEVEEPERTSFWRRKTSTGSQTAPSLFRRVSGQSQTGVMGSLTPKRPASPHARVPPTPGCSDEVRQRCIALLHDLDSTVADFSALLAERRSRYPAVPLTTAVNRASIDSTRSEEFYDAEEGHDQPRLIHIVQSDHDEEKDFESDAGSESSSEDDVEPPASAIEAPSQGSLFPQGKDITPRTVPDVSVRTTVAPPKQPPPSIIGFLRKNAGKDLSTIAMPVTANEPTSLLQRLAEPFESASLLTRACSPALSGPDQTIDRLLYVAAFAVAGFAGNRVKERALRKPFNPMLGETYELVRQEDEANAYRFIAEKVMHHPVQMAWQADSLSGRWSVSQSPRPTQKFWGKSAELNTAGKVRVRLHGVTNGERYSWTQATCFLRNVIAGEKYVEPVQTMAITNLETGHRAMVTFKASGMFSGRSEDVIVALFSPESQTPLPVSLIGKWTTSLVRSDTGETIWEAGPLVTDAHKVWGFTRFAAGLNEITEVEKDCAPTDSRLRPDQRALEDGQLDQAEGLKAKLEERQRGRRKTLEMHGKVYEPAFFVKSTAEVSGSSRPGSSDDDEQGAIWVLKDGKKGYWQRRERHDWDGLVPIFEP